MTGTKTLLFDLKRPIMKIAAGSTFFALITEKSCGVLQFRKNDKDSNPGLHFGLSIFWHRFSNS
jgi:hypothetical protein